MAYSNPDAGKAYRCTTCRTEKPGRFTRIYPQSSGWQQGKTHVRWYCWDCHPFGQGLRPAETTDAPQSQGAA
jgi:hypothetical protein